MSNTGTATVSAADFQPGFAWCLTLFYYDGTHDSVTEQPLLFNARVIRLPPSQINTEFKRIEITISYDKSSSLLPVRLERIFR